MDFGCVFYYSWVPPQLNLIAFLALTLLAVRYDWWAKWLTALLAPWLWLSQGQPGWCYYLTFALLVLSFRANWHGCKRTLRPRLYSYVLASYLGYVTLPAQAGVPIQITHCCTYCYGNLRNLACALEMYESDHKRLPATLEQLTPDYLNRLPACISTPTNATARHFYRSRGIQIGEGYTYQRLPQNHYLLRCSNHGIPGHDPNPPSYDSRPDPDSLEGKDGKGEGRKEQTFERPR